MLEPPHEGETEKQGVPGLPAALRGQVPPGSEDRPGGEEQERPPRGREDVGDPDEDPRRQGEGVPEVGKDPHDLRDDEGQQEHDDEGGHDRHQERIGERGADPVPGPGLLLEVIGEAGEGERERPALLARPHHAGVEVRERLGVALHGARQRRPTANGFQQVDEDLPALRVVHLGRHRLQGAHERYARSQERRELPGEEGEEIRPSEKGGEESGLALRRPLRQGEREDPLRVELPARENGGVRLEDSLLRDAGPGDPGVAERRHGPLTPPA